MACDVAFHHPALAPAVDLVRQWAGACGVNAEIAAQLAEAICIEPITWPSDLLDVIRESCGLTAFGDVVEEARRFLSLPRVDPVQTINHVRARAAMGSPEAAQRLIAMAQPIRGTLVETYLAGRGIAPVHDAEALRYHPRCYYRPDDGGPAERRPAMIASVTDLQGRITGAHRTWLAPDGSGKAPVETPRRAMGDLLGHGVRFGTADELLAVGEGIETVLSPRQVLPRMPMLAALSAAHLAAVLFPPSLRRLYVLHDRDPAGDGTRDSLLARAASLGIEAISLTPREGDILEYLIRNRHRVVTRALACQFCNRLDWAESALPDHPCTTAIPVAWVIAAAEELLRSFPPEP